MQIVCTEIHTVCIYPLKSRYIYGIQRLNSSALQAEAVTVTALGGRKQNRALGYATSTVKGDELARTNTLRPANALQGKVAGVQISSGGASGLTAAPTVTIRGANSLTKNN